MLIAIFVIFTN